jgi:DnaJ-class molecular chaperone
MDDAMCNWCAGMGERVTIEAGRAPCDHCGGEGVVKIEDRLRAAIQDAIESCDTISGISMSGGHVATKLDEARTIAKHLSRRLRNVIDSEHPGMSKKADTVRP